LTSLIGALQHLALQQTQTFRQSCCVHYVIWIWNLACECRNDTTNQLFCNKCLPDHDRREEIRQSSKRVVLDSVSRNDLIHIFLSCQLRFLGHLLLIIKIMLTLCPIWTYTWQGQLRTNYITYIQKNNRTSTIHWVRTEKTGVNLWSSVLIHSHPTRRRRRRRRLILYAIIKNNKDTCELTVFLCCRSCWVDFWVSLLARTTAAPRLALASDAASSSSRKSSATSSYWQQRKPSIQPIQIPTLVPVNEHIIQGAPVAETRHLCQCHMANLPLTISSENQDHTLLSILPAQLIVLWLP